MRLYSIITPQSNTLYHIPEHTGPLDALRGRKILVICRRRKSPMQRP
jgi:hypothetical protein